MPLSKIDCKPVPRDVVEKIERLSGGKARLAVDLIDFEAKLEPAMQMIFGRYFVCDDRETAKKIINMPNGFDCVTIQGDKYERSGLLHGGHQAQGDNLKKVQDYLVAYKGKLNAAKQIHELREQLKNLQETEQHV